MDDLNEIGEGIRAELDIRTRLRDQALLQARQLTRHAANTIRAVHRQETDLAHEHLDQARLLVESLKSSLAPHPDLYFAGYTQDAIKEYAEASITCALILNQPLPTPEVLGTEYATYLNGLAEAVGELRRRCLDILRQGYSQEASRLLDDMDDIYGLLVTLDYPDAVTNGLRRQTDVVRSLVERTRADLTIAIREHNLKQSLDALIQRLPPKT